MKYSVSIQMGPDTSPEIKDALLHRGFYLYYINPQNGEIIPVTSGNVFSVRKEAYLYAIYNGDKFPDDDLLNMLDSENSVVSFTISGHH